MEDGRREEIAIPRFLCKYKDCKRTISVPDPRLAPRKKYEMAALMPMVVCYLRQLISYQHAAWAAENVSAAPSTLWRTLKAIADEASSKFATLQRKLIDSGVSVIEFAMPVKDCPNTAKAKRVDMFLNLGMARRLYEMSEQFLPELTINRVLMLAVKYGRHYDRICHPHKMEDGLF